MRPLTVLIGIVLGSAAATAFGLAATLVVFLVLADETPQFRDELPMLARYLAIFVGLTALAGLSFIGQVHARPWRRRAQGALWAAIALLAGLYLYYSRGSG